MRISVLGATGSMGGLVIKSALQDGFEISNKISSRDNISDLFQSTDVIVDFSCSVATEAMLEYILDKKLSVPVIIGTTGLSVRCLDLMKRCSQFVPVFCSPNMSFVISIVNVVIYSIAKLLDESYDVEILDIHHRLKKDAPSGTALMLGKSVAQARRRNFKDVAVFMRHGILSQRQQGEIGFSVQRCGNAAGIHNINFIGSLDSIEIKHTAHSKEIFAKGAVKVIRWIVQQAPNLYTMNDFIRDMILPVIKSLYKDLFSYQRDKL